MTQPENRTIYSRDNLDVLRGINSACVDLIYLDPPFNKKKKFVSPLGEKHGAFDDIFKRKHVKEEWLQSIKDDHDELHTLLEAVKDIEGGWSYNFCYLAYMAIRLIECHRVLKDTGSLYLHCDPTMSHYLKLTLDCIFGEANFRNEIVWWYGGGGAAKTYWGRKHDILMFYTKSDKWTFNVDSVRESYKWDKGQKRADGSARDLQKGKLPDDVFRIHSEMPWSEQYTSYPTQKPLALLERIIRASSNEGDLVLDPFCGCAPTCVAAELLNREWIGVDIDPLAYELVKKRLSLQKLQKSLTGRENCARAVKQAKTPPTRTDGGAATDLKEPKYVYVISHPAYPGKYKIGFAKEPRKRLNSMQTGDPYRAYKIEGAPRLTARYKELERHIHNKFNADHEWITADLQAVVKAIDAYNAGD